MEIESSTESDDSAMTLLTALAQPQRLAIFRMLVVAGPEGLAAGEIAQRAALPLSTLSFHIAQLHRAGLVSQRRIGRGRIYAADFGVMNALIGYLTENCCGGVSCLPMESAA